MAQSGGDQFMRPCHGNIERVCNILKPRALEPVHFEGNAGSIVQRRQRIAQYVQFTTRNHDPLGRWTFVRRLPFDVHCITAV